MFDFHTLTKQFNESITNEISFLLKFEQILECIQSQHDKEKYQSELVEQMKMIFTDDQYIPQQKFLALFLLKQCMSCWEPHLISCVSQKLMNKLKMFALFDCMNFQNQQRGSKLFGQQPDREQSKYSNYFFQLNLECLQKWAFCFGLLPKHGVFKSTYQELQKKKIYQNISQFFYSDLKDIDPKIKQLSFNNTQTFKSHKSDERMLWFIWKVSSKQQSFESLCVSMNKDINPSKSFSSCISEVSESNTIQDQYISRNKNGPNNQWNSNIIVNQQNSNIINQQSSNIINQQNSNIINQQISNSNIQNQQLYDLIVCNHENDFEKHEFQQELSRQHRFDNNEDQKECKLVNNSQMNGENSYAQQMIETDALIDQIQDIQYHKNMKEQQKRELQQMLEQQDIQIKALKNQIENQQNLTLHSSFNFHELDILELEKDKLIYLNQIDQLFRILNQLKMLERNDPSQKEKYQKQLMKIDNKIFEKQNHINQIEQRLVQQYNFNNQKMNIDHNRLVGSNLIINDHNRVVTDNMVDIERNNNKMANYNVVNTDYNRMVDDNRMVEDNKMMASQLNPQNQISGISMVNTNGHSNKKSYVQQFEELNSQTKNMVKAPFSSKYLKFQQKLDFLTKEYANFKLNILLPYNTLYQNETFKISYRMDQPQNQSIRFMLQFENLSQENISMDDFQLQSENVTKVSKTPSKIEPGKTERIGFQVKDIPKIQVMLATVTIRSSTCQKVNIVLPLMINRFFQFNGPQRPKHNNDVYLYQDTKVDQFLMNDVESITKLIPTAEIDGRLIRIGFMYNQQQYLVIMELQEQQLKVWMPMDFDNQDVINNIINFFSFVFGSKQ